ncbi:hypothetical protein NK718_16835 [Alsobacter sp. SYSU M60028]|uniref:OmpA-like domain-containing protein n=1 Tax=Alsobacter ponti TaxID=2962936 RepID=A0ABT1LH35_9HYPH|nr:hypothetical protein [Alsobacter ponti]MCP8940193.1 hypothetical protein [Alsobacter ponti]
MAGGHGEQEENIWPGFVDALTTMVMVLTLIMMLLGIVIFILSQGLSRRYLVQIAAAAGVEIPTEGGQPEVLARQIVKVLKARNATIHGPNVDAPWVGAGDSPEQGLTDAPETLLSGAGMGGGEKRVLTMRPENRAGIAPAGDIASGGKDDIVERETGDRSGNPVTVGRDTTAQPQMAAVEPRSPGDDPRPGVAPAAKPAASPDPLPREPTPSEAQAQAPSQAQQPHQPQAQTQPPKPVQDVVDSAGNPVTVGRDTMAQPQMAAVEPRSPGDAPRPSVAPAAERAASSDPLPREPTPSEAKAQASSQAQRTDQAQAPTQAPTQAQQSDQAQAQTQAQAQARTQPPRPVQDVSDSAGKDDKSQREADKGAEQGAAIEITALPPRGGEWIETTNPSPAQPRKSGGKVESPGEIVAVDFKAEATVLDAEAAKALQAAIRSAGIVGKDGRIEVRGLADIESPALSEARRAAYYRAFAVRQKLIETGVAATRITMRLEDSDKVKGRNLVLVSSVQ